MVPDSHLMVEKIVKLQRLIAKRQEKCEFLEEHIATLLEEIKKKNRLIQHYICTSEAGGALSTNNMEANKVKLEWLLLIQHPNAYSSKHEKLKVPDRFMAIDN